MNEKQLADVIAAVIITVGMIGTLTLINLIKESVPVTDREESIVFSRALTDSPAYKQCVKENRRTIEEFVDCLKDKGAM